MKCPGQDMQYWKEDAIYEVPCPRCTEGVEFYKDDTSRRCQACGHRFVNPRMDFGCAAYCQFAKQCLGDMPEEISILRKNLFRERLAIAVKKFLQPDFALLSKTTRFVDHVESLVRPEDGLDMSLVLAVAYLLPMTLDHTAGLIEAEAILKDLQAPAKLIGSVRSLLTALSGDTVSEGAEFRVLSASLLRYGDEENGL